MPLSPARVKTTTDGNILGHVEAEAPLDVQANTIAVVEAETLNDTLTNVESKC